ncbi:tripartite tricarboxylate transporter substrate binding protein [Hydrogenophaga sp.]|uniref:Bug family tripartite tricarboxylate transporter substrate binding protein n=1 Tax=Hydrogenophaga sp. TaxID=1904254 RepID=UPI00261184D4|nr:tripartite tricarboxylate transporter substrate binding protein [Hydrogenophaga sp.]MCW5654737.1 tripartite tricarboxylate transporter substrate binding protein [Hydrogenophaga sp.]
MTPKHTRRRRGALFSLLASACVLGLGLPATAQEVAFPTKPVRLMLATAPGGATDILARLMADKLSAAWGQPVLVEQRVGANGMIAASALAKAPPDGHVAYLSISSVVQNVLLRPNPGYKMEELAPVTLVATIPIAFGVSSTLNIQSVADLVKYAKAKPNGITYGTSGTGSGSHLVGAALAGAAGFQATHIPYKGEVSSLADLLSEQLTVGYGSAGFYAAQEAAGKVKVLAVTGPKRVARYPHIPTLAEAGYPGANLPGWYGLFLPAGTPKAVVAKFSDEVRRIIAMPDMQAKIQEVGFVSVGNSPEEFSRYIATEVDTWSRVIQQNNIKVD